MSKINLGKYSVSELETLQIEIEHAIIQKREHERMALREKMEAMAASEGYSLDELFGRGKGKKLPLPPKYRNPDNPSQVWSGRGRKPRWLEDKLKKGAKLEDFLI